MNDDGLEEFDEYSDDLRQVPEEFRVEEHRPSYMAGGPRDLIAWQKAMEVTRAIYASTRNWPSDERYGLTSQVRRSAVSVPANIAEGHGRTGNREFLHHLSIASGSLREVETLLEVGRDAEYLTDAEFVKFMMMCQDARRPLRGLIAYLRGKS